MAKRAFCVGINDYPYDGSDLNGCVNDARASADLLTQHFDFPTSDATVMTEDEATKARIVAGLKDLLHGANAGDVLILQLYLLVEVLAAALVVAGSGDGLVASAPD